MAATWVRSAVLRLPALGLLPSLAIGVGHWAATSCRSGPPAPRSARFEFAPPVIALGVGQSRAKRSRPFSCFRSPPRLRKLSVCGVGQLVILAHCKDEQSLAPVRCADFRRRKQSCRKDVAHADQFSGDLGKSEAQMIGDIFEENDRGIAFSDDAGDMGPQMARISFAETPSGNREWLARVARSEDIHEAAPWSAFEGGNVVPDRCRIQGLVCHPRHESGRCVGFPLDVTHSAISGTSDVESEIEPASAGAQGEAVQACVIAPRSVSGGR